MSIAKARSRLKQKSNSQRAVTSRKFFKNCQDDTFLGVSSQYVREIAKEFYLLPLKDIVSFMKSRVHEERSLAHAILRIKFKKANLEEQSVIFNFYIKNRKYIRDWDGVDDSAPYIAGPYLLDKNKKILYKLASSRNLWDRRIAIVTTWWFIRQNSFVDTLKLAEILLEDEEDLIHKAVGWMLRELGKRDLVQLKKFLKLYADVMPRTMLRYAIEKFSEKERKAYLAIGKKKR